MPTVTPAGPRQGCPPGRRTPPSHPAPSDVSPAHRRPRSLRSITWTIVNGAWFRQQRDERGRRIPGSYQEREPSPQEVAVRLQGTQQGRQLSFDDLVEHATWVLDDIRRHPEKRPNLERKFDHNRRVSPLGIRKIQARKSERYGRARELVASGMTSKEAAAELGCSSRTVQRALAEVRSPTNPIPPHPPNDLISGILKSESLIRCESDGVCRSRQPTGTLAYTFEANTGHTLTNAQAAQLARWEAQIGDGEEIVDVVRLIVHARGKRNPWRYVASKVPGYIGNSESRRDLERMATPRAVEYSRYAADPRAYLATCIRNERPPVPPADRSDGFLESYRRRHGRLPWDNPPDPLASPDDRGKLEQGQKPVFSAGSTEKRPQIRPVAAPKLAQTTWGAPTGGTDPVKLERRPCRHPLTGLLATVMRLEDVVQIDCPADGCSCRIYSDRGAIECPCHWPSNRVSRLRGRLEAGRAACLTRPGTGR